MQKRHLLCVGLALLLSAQQLQAAFVTPTKSNGTFISGTEVPADNFTVVTAGSGEELALKGRNRDSGEPLSQSGNIYFVSPGLAANAVSPALTFDFQFSPGTAGVHRLISIFSH